MKSPRRWLSPLPERCDLHRLPGDHSLEAGFVDGRMALSSMWATMCTRCHRMHGVGLGVGRGQHYSKDGTLIAGGMKDTVPESE